jgi:uncharacterized repeat protein (TIGR01451 family)
MATTVKTNKQDYAPGQTVSIRAEGFGEMAGIRFQVINLGLDGVLGTQDDLSYASWTVANGFRPALDANGNPLPAFVDTTWVVPRSALNSTLVLTAEAVFSGADHQLGTADDVATGEVAMTMFTDGPNPAPTQVFYVPFPEDQLLTGLQAIESGSGSTNPTNPVQTYISVAASANNTIIYYDQWENGYDVDIANPNDLYSSINPGGTQIWGDGDISNGAAPGVVSNAADVINAGTVIVLNNAVQTGTLQSVIDFDGRDKIAATKSVALTHVGWASGSNTLLAGAVEVFDTKSWGTEYRVPVGANIPDSADSQMFEYTSLYIMAGPGGATVQIDKDASGSFETTVTLSEGQPYFVNGGVNVGGRVSSDKPVQVHFLTGDIGSNYESRDSALLPLNLWSSSYYTPVSTAATNSEATTVWLYNPSTSGITVNYETRTGAGGNTITTTPLSVAAGSYLKQTVPDGYGAHFYTPDPDGAGPGTAPTFYAFSTTNSTDTSGGNQAWDWGFTLIPRESLSPQVLVGLGIGRDPTSGTNPNENGNPVWVSPVGNGNTAATIYIDYDANPLTGALTDPNGNKYDTSVSLRELDRAKIYDTVDRNQTGMLVYTLTPGVKLVAAWGQDPATASAGAPGLDVGTGIPPLALFGAGKDGSLSTDNDGNGVVSAGDEMLYTIVINNTSRSPISDIRLRDVLPVDTTYVTGSTFFKNAAGVISQIPDDSSGTAFPLDGLGFILNPGNPLPVGGSYQVTFKVLIDSVGDLEPGTTSIVNNGSASAGGVTIDFSDTTPLVFVSIEKQVSVNGTVWLDADDAPGPTIAVGQDIYFRVAVTNSGALPATVDLFDQILAGGGSPHDFKFSGSQTTILAPNTTIYSDVILATAEAGSHEDRASANVTVTDGNVTSTVIVVPDDANYFGATGAVEIEKQVSADNVNWHDADDAPGVTILAGEEVYYRVRVTNSGALPATVNLSDVNVVGGDPALDFKFSGNQTTTVGVGQIIYSDVISGIAAAGQHTDQASAQVTVTDGTNTTPISVAPDNANYFGGQGAIVIEKELSIDGGSTWIPADSPTGPVILAGSTVKYRVAVTNNSTGDLTATVDLNDATITGSVPFLDFAFGGNQTTTVAAGVTVYSDEIITTALAGQQTDRASAVASVSDGVNSAPVVVLPDDANYFGAQPSLNIVKTADPSGQVADVAGEAISYTITVANTGNQSLTGIVVSDPNATAQAPTYVSGDAGVIGTLDVGETWTYSAAHTVTQGEIDSNGGGDGFIENIATADSDQTDPDSDDEAVPVARAPSLNIVKTADPSGQVADVAGEAISYTITVANTGNQSLTGIVVSDPNATAQAPTYVSGDAGVIGTLDVGETWTYSAAHTVTQGEIDSNGGGDGFIENIATADSDQTDPDSDDEAVPVARAPSLNIVKTADPSGQVADVAGEAISYTITVANTGNQSLTGIVVSDPNATAQAPTYVSGDAGVIGTLDVGETWTYSAAHTVTQGEIDSNGGGDGFIENIATADSDQTDPDSDDEAVPVARAPSLNIVKTADPSGQVADVAGEAISYTITVANTGNQSLTGVVVSDPNATAQAPTYVSGDAGVIGTLDVGETWTYSAAHTVTQGEIDSNGGGDGFIENIATADSDQTDPDSDDEAVPVARAPSLNIVKTADPSGQVADVAGEAISYTITVANTGNQSLTGIVVSDPNATAQAPTYVSGDAGVIGTLDVGETWTYSAAHTVTQGEIDSNGGGDGFIENIATADSDQTDPDSDDEAVPVAQRPSLNIVKTADPSGQVADVAGEAISYTITVANTGNQSLTGVVVSDPNATAQAPTYVSGDAGVIGTLDVGETWTYSAAHTVTQGEIDSNGGGDGFIENIATADSDQTDPDSDDEAVPVARAPSLNIVKTADPSGQVADVAGEAISYTITVANTGNQSLTGIVVSDPNATAQAPTYVSGDAGVIGTLDVGETWTYSAAHTVTQGEIDSNGGGDGFIENIATADSDQTDPDSDDEAVPVARAPSLNIVKTADPSGQVADVAGEAISYTITVANTGNQSLTGIVVSDPNATAQAPTYVSGDAGVIGTLDVGETWTYSAAHTVTQGEIDSDGGGDGDLDNTATADSDQTGPDSDDEAVPVAQRPSLNIVKTADPSGQVADVAGEAISYTITVANTGNQSLTGIVVSDPNATAQAPTYVSGDAGVIGTLDVGETWTYSAAHTVTQGEIDSNGGGDGFIENIATADSDQTDPDSDDEAVPVARAPSLNIVKTADPSGQVADVAGEAISYTITVANTGNQSLTGVVVSDPNATAQAPTYVSGDAGVIGTLEVGETWTYSAAHTVTQAEIDSDGGGDGDLDNTATADSDQTGPDSDDEAVPVAQRPSLNIVKTADPSGQVADVAGEAISYTITVANTGNQSLTGVVVSDPNATAQAPTYVSGDAGVIGTLDVGETWTYSAAHTVTQGEIDSNGGGDGFIENIATADSDQTDPDSDDEAVPVARAPSLNIVKTADPSGQVADVAGEAISYTITVANTGNQSLTGIVVSDPNATAQAPTYVSGDAGVIGTLDVGETWTYSAAHTVTQGEIDSNGGGDGFIENIATADSDQTDPDSDDEAVPVARAPSLNIVKTADPSGQVADVAGEAISYTITVANTGNQSLTGIVVSDPNATAQAPTYVSGDAGVIGTLDVGETWTYSAAHTVTQGEIDSNGGGDGFIENIATADSDQTDPDSDDEAVPVARAPSLNIVKTADPSGQVADVAGEAISYTITVANTGNQSLTGIVVSDPNATAQAPTYVSGDAGVIGTLDVGETWTYSAAHTVTQGEIDSNGGGDGFIENIATADSDQTDPDSDDEAVPVARAPSLNIVKTADPSGQVADVAGEAISYTITVANTGNQSLTGVVVSDPNATAQAPTYVSGDAGVIGTLDVGETWTYSAAHTVTQGEIDSNGGGDGFIENIATADSDQTDPDSDDEAVPVAQRPSLNIVKTADPSGQVADVAGEAITYTITVANTGNQSLTGIVVSDPNATAQAPTYVSGDAGVIGTLDVGETWTYSAAHTVTQGEIDSNGGGDGFIENIATADSDQTDPDTDDEAVPVAQRPSLNIVKTADPSGQVADVAGEAITYTITVANTGNQSLTGIVVSDPNATAQAPTYVSGDAGVIGTLEVGETWTYSAAHTVTQAEIDSDGGGDGDLDNTATADSDQTGPDSDDEAVPVAQRPSLNIVKTADPSGQVADVAGEAISYTITVANTGNQSLTGIVVSDPNATAQAPTYVSGDAGVLGVLDVGETWTYSAAHTVTQAEIDSNGGGDGFIENIATADSDQTDPDTDDEAVPVAQRPSLNIVKTADPSGQVADVAGEAISYTITVANTGNQSLTGIVVSDPNATAQAPTYVSGDAGVLGVLDVGETWTYSAVHTVTQAEIDSDGGGDGDLDNIATADSDQTDPDTDDEAVPVAQRPSLNIVKTADPSGQVADVAGEAITYTITVANTGNQSLTGIVVSDPNATAQAPTYVSGDAGVLGVLDVGETWTYSAAHTVTQAEIDSNGGGDGFIDNIATADSDQTGPDTDDARVPVGDTPALEINKVADPSGQVADVAGEAISYTITVANTGNQSLTGIVVSDPNATAQAPTYVSGDAGVLGVLDVGETWTYSAAHTVTQAEIDSDGGGDGDLDNIATADSDQTGPDSDDEAVPVAQRPSLNIVKTADPSGQVADVAGEAISYTITVANTGNQSLTGVVVSDPNATAQAPTYVSGDAGVLGVLDVGETWTYSAAHTVTQAEIDSDGGGDGDLDNIATADSDQTDPDTDDEAVPVAQRPSLNIVKTADPSGQVADVAGEAITYTITVANTGNQSLTGIVVSDPNATAQAPTYVSGDAGVLGVLDVGETWTYSAAHTVTQAEIDSNGGGDGFIDNIATADSDQTGPDTDDARVPVGDTPALEINKVADPSGQVADVAGEAITYTITVANTGNQSLTGIVVSDPNATAQAPTYVSGDAGVLGVLDVGETWTYSAAHTVTQAEIDSDGGGDGDLDNIATADSDQTGPDSDDEAVPVAQRPSLNIVKTADPSGQVADVAGEAITYTITVANTGNQSLTGVVVSDPNATAQAPTYVSGDAGVLGVLDAGETWTYSAAHTVTQAEIDSDGGGDGDLDNTATADSDQTGPDSDDEAVPVAQRPSLNIVKTADPSGQVADVAGEAITYTITVANTGNQSLTGIVVSDPNATAQAPTYVSGDAGVLGVLDVGETWTYSAAHTVTQAEIDSDGGGDGDLDNIATADSDQTGPDSDDEAVPVAQRPSLNIVKTADPSGQVADVAGEAITYTITVANTGNQSLTGIVVSDPNATAQAPTYVSGDAGVIGTLDVGETWTYSAAHTVTQGEIDSNGGGDGFIENIATADSDQTDPDSDDEAVPVARAPSLNIVKTADPSGQVADVAGEAISYTITVANTGNQSLTGIVVSDPNATAQAPTYVSGDAGVIGTLDVGETWTYSAAHTRDAGRDRQQWRRRWLHREHCDCRQRPDGSGHGRRGRAGCTAAEPEHRQDGRPVRPGGRCGG